MKQKCAELIYGNVEQCSFRFVYQRNASYPLRRQEQTNVVSCLHFIPLKWRRKYANADYCLQMGKSDHISLLRINREESSEKMGILTQNPHSRKLRREITVGLAL